MARSRWTEQEARGVMVEWTESGKSARAFAQDKGVDPERLYRWRRTLDRKVARPGAEVAAFVPVRVVEPRGGPVTVELRSGHSIKLSRGFDEELLARVVAVLEGE